MHTLLHSAQGNAVNAGLTAADAVWLATAILHYQHPDDLGFPPVHIRNQVFIFELTKAQPRTVYQHIVQHVTASQPANPNRRRMLTELPNGYRRLYIKGDAYHPSREDGQSIPKIEDLPPDLRQWLPWYEHWSKDHLSKLARSPTEDPLERLAGTWTFGDADSYLREMRDGWEGRP
jgi:hypothetical protein